MVVIFDIEASCEDKNINKHYSMETIEIGAVKINDGIIVDEFQTFVKPQYINNLTKFCVNLTGITDEDLKNAPEFNEAITKFYSFIYGETIYSCGAFDKKFLVRELNEKGNLYSHELAKNAINTSHRNLKKLFNDITGKKMMGMKGMANHLNIELEGKHHRGIDDARNLSKIYLKLEEIRCEKFWKVFKNVDYVLATMSELHNQDFELLKDKIIYSGKEHSIGAFVDEWGDVMMKDYKINNLKYINEETYKTISKLIL